MKTSSVAPTQLVKSQRVRLLDVFVIGPLMVWGGVKSMQHSKPLGVALAMFGATTVFYNAQNYLQIERRKP